MTNATYLHLLITVPFCAGVLAFLLPRRLGGLVKLAALAVTALTLYASVALFLMPKAGAVDLLTAPAWTGTWSGRSLLALDWLNSLILMGAAFFAVVMAVYSIGFLKDDKTPPSAYWGYYLLVAGSAAATILARDLLVLTVFWAFMGIPFFLLVNLGGKGADSAAKKMLILLGGTDGLLILGVVLVYRARGSLDILQAAMPPGTLSVVACLCIAAAALAKAGAMPFHSWVPQVAESAPVPAVAFLPASLDKLLGIYLFARVMLGLFVIGPTLQALFLLVGAVTVVAAVMAALMEHNLRRLLGFHAVSQVGYMVIGIATGTAIGVLGGLFHMLNHAVYKSLLFLTAGAVEQKTGTGELDRMGGLARIMPGTFSAATIAALAISGVPPLNGFVSKWMIYQGTIEMGPKAGMWVFALVAAMFGSAFTFASFFKVLHSVYLGQPHAEQAAKGPGPGLLMGVPMAVLAGICLLFGVLAYRVPVRLLLLPALPAYAGAIEEGVLQNPSWQPLLATVLLISALVVGAVIYLLTGMKTREDNAFVGGEAGAKAASFRFSGLEFYGTIKQIPLLGTFYKHAAQGWYDVYQVGSRFVFYIAGTLQAFHSGLLLTYVAWFIAGVVILLWFLVGAH